MIDFRYHIVSLISVFLALAVGIALGAGPLKETIGDTLTGQVEGLRAEKESLRSELDRTGGELAAADAFASASGERLLAGALTDRRVALVLVDDVPEDEVAALVERFTQAGAEISATVTVDAAWTDPAMATYRRTLAGTVMSYLDQPPAADAGADAELAEALVSGLVGADSAAPDALSENASSLLDVLAAGDRPLVSYAQDVTRPADAVVVVAGTPVEPADGDATAAPTPVTFDAQLALAAAAQRLSEGAVVAGTGTDGDDLVAAVRGDDALADTVTTVADVATVSGQVVVPLALAAAIADQPGHYGYGDGLQTLPPAVQLTPVDRTPVVPEADDAAAQSEVPDQAGGEG
ncbi:copper transporter [Cellulomonas sp. zg-ZUI199]|uniref:Copper transporter n=1 Tax=Cellulomonas wangleii TaxID=2816956 RepID=A0ABX8DAE3_9CELL|nr:MULTISPECIES: copper transporter [Cellulomonas]MBO0900555.1 copper transporter [Cellulomonas sp. zg-ZUI22]MBO0926520.1 copper transporter [Cellulomonas wangleii]QVI63820.1 copper transporter [Cellulomonas wangleii]